MPLFHAFAALLLMLTADAADAEPPLSFSLSQT